MTSTTAEARVTRVDGRRAIASDAAADFRFVVACALLFVGASVATVVGCTSMSAMGEMPMPGGWTMSMMWMRMPDTTWHAAGMSFVGMWTVMMSAMMLPSLTPALLRYRRALRVRRTGALRHTTWLFMIGYGMVWALIGAVVFALGAALAAVEMMSPALSRPVPVAGGAVVAIAGVLQLTRWKAHTLAACRAALIPVIAASSGPAAAWRCGVRLGTRCSASCAALTAALLVVGVMDLGAMTFVTVAVTLERMPRAGARIARAVGVVLIVGGLALIVRAAGL